jgi:hypothetical protein
MIPTRAMALEHGIASALVRATERFVPGAASHEPTMHWRQSGQPACATCYTMACTGATVGRRCEPTTFYP